MFVQRLKLANSNFGKQLGFATSKGKPQPEEKVGVAFG